MILVSTIWFSGTPDIMVWPEIILVIALVRKIQDVLHFCKVKLYKLPSFSTERTKKHNFVVYHNRVFGYARHSVWLESTLYIALWVKSKMETKNYYNCQQKGSRFVILVTTM